MSDPRTIEDVENLPNHFHSKSLADACNKARDYFMQTHSISARFVYNFKFFEGDQNVYLFYLTNHVHKVYAIINQ